MNRSPLFLALLIPLALPAGCGKKDEGGARLDTFPVRVQAAAQRDLEETLTLVGTIKARDEATLFSRVPGKLLKNLVVEGAWVTKGQAVSLVERDEVGVKYEPAPVPSTLDGVVARVYLDRGANVTPATPVALVVDQRAVVVEGEVPERYAGRATVKQPVRVTVAAYPDKVFEGEISRLSPVVDTATRSTYMEATLDNQGGALRAGMFAKLHLVLARNAAALAVPIEALADEGDALFVVADGKAVQRPVEIGLRTDQYVEIKKGLAAGEAVVTFGLVGLKDGSPVEIVK
jgi:membrane fusion protein, multidrug efflux system